MSTGTPEEIEIMIEEVAGAHRPPQRDDLRYHPAWHDLGEDDRVRAFERARALRKIESALDPEGLSTTAHAVLAKLRDLA
jgi:hypothetical protein